MNQVTSKQNTVRDTIQVTAKCQTTLLLDNLWMPIRVIQAGRVFYYLFRDRVTSLDLDLNPYNRDQWLHAQADLVASASYPMISSARDKWAVPTIAIVNHPFKRDRRVSKKVCLDELLELYDYTCQICLQQFNRSAFDPREIFNRDHVLPRSKGGPDDDFNIVLACKQCNSQKGSEYPYYNANGEEIRAKLRTTFSDLAIGSAGIRKEWRPFLFKEAVA
ncbi:MAG: HNH endonuclease signature motif containing protein [Verrucomicrobiota bacterium]